MEKSLESVTMAVQLLLVQLTKASRYDASEGLSHGCHTMSWMLGN